MPAILGADCKLYRNTGTYATPTWDEVTIVKDLQLNMEKGEADATTRGAGGWKQTMSALKDGGVDFGIVWDKSSTDFTAFKDAFFNNTQIDVAVMDGAIDTAGSSGLRAEMGVFGFSRDESLETAVSADVTMKPGYSANPPVWMVVP